MAYVWQVIIWRFAEERVSSFRIVVSARSSEDDLPATTKKDTVLNGRKKSINLTKVWNCRINIFFPGLEIWIQVVQVVQSYKKYMLLNLKSQNMLVKVLGHCMAWWESLCIEAASIPSNP